MSGPTRVEKMEARLALEKAKRDVRRGPWVVVRPCPSVSRLADGEK